MKRFILRFTGPGSKPPADTQRIVALPGLHVVDNDSSRMMLVEAAPEELRSLISKLPSWEMCEEQMVPLPNPRQKTRSKP